MPGTWVQRCSRWENWAGQKETLGSPPPIEIEPVDKNNGHSDSNLCTGRTPPQNSRNLGDHRRVNPRCFQTAWWSGNLKKKLNWGKKKKKGLWLISAPSTLQSQLLHRETQRWGRKATPATHTSLRSSTNCWNNFIRCKLASLGHTPNGTHWILKCIRILKCVHWYSRAWIYLK